MVTTGFTMMVLVSPFRVILDGYSEFRVNSSGLISQHHMDCMMPSKRRARSKVPQTLISDEAPLAS